MHSKNKNHTALKEFLNRDKISFSEASEESDVMARINFKINVESLDMEFEVLAIATPISVSFMSTFDLKVPDTHLNETLILINEVNRRSVLGNLEINDGNIFGRGSVGCYDEQYQLTDEILRTAFFTSLTHSKTVKDIIYPFLNNEFDLNTQIEKIRNIGKSA